MLRVSKLDTYVLCTQINKSKFSRILASLEPFTALTVTYADLKGPMELSSNFLMVTVEN